MSRKMINIPGAELSVVASPHSNLNGLVVLQHQPAADVSEEWIVYSVSETGTVYAQYSSATKLFGVRMIGRSLVALGGV